MGLYFPGREARRTTQGVIHNDNIRAVPRSAAAATPPLTRLSDDDALVRQSVREFARTAVAPLVGSMDAAGAIPRGLIDQCFALGIMGIEVPEAQGGAGGTFFQSIIAVEELARVDPALAVLVDVQNTLVVNAMRRAAPTDLAAVILPQLATRSVGAYALSEAGSGSDAFALECRAREDGDAFVLDGRKLWITNAAEADWFIVFATVNPDAGHHGITAFAVERSTPGLSVGRKERKLGIRASSTCELLLDGCRVSKTRLLGEAGTGYRLAIDTLNEGRIGIGAQMVGLADGALAHAIAYTKDRRQFGKAVADFQGVQFQLARAATEIEAARLLVYNAARLRDQGQPFVTEAAMCKLFASEVAERTASLAVNLFGGYGYVDEYPVEKLFRDAKIGQIYEGTSNIQLQTIAKAILSGTRGPA
jgi:alkylation response protein AidB-like acyl-CoA dehydrogenase